MQRLTLKQSDLIRWFRLNALSFQENGDRISIVLQAGGADFIIETSSPVTLNPDPLREHLENNTCKLKNAKAS